jgi:hypothetical protein
MRSLPSWKLSASRKIVHAEPLAGNGFDSVGFFKEDDPQSSDEAMS